MAEVKPAEIEKYLAGMNFPASKDDLINYVQGQDAPEEILNMLKSLPEKEYGAVADITGEMKGEESEGEEE